MNMVRGSIRRRLITLLLGSVGVAWLMIFLWSFYSAKHEMMRWDETRIIQLAPLLIKLDVRDLNRLSVTGIDARNEIPQNGWHVRHDSDVRKRFVQFRVSDEDGNIVSISEHFPSNYIAEHPEQSISYVTFAGAAWLSHVAYDASSKRILTLLEPLNQRSDLVTGVAARIARPALVGLPLAMVLVWFVIGIGLKPLNTLTAAVSERDSRNLSPIRLPSISSELVPVVSSINDLLERLRLSLSKERTFTADAAHELRTPLTAIKVQAQVALTSSDLYQQQTALRRVILGVDRSAHLIQQLLLLARIDHRANTEAAVFLLQDVAIEAIGYRREQAKEKSISLQVTGDAQVSLHGDPILFRVLIDNLLDNSIKYGTSGGFVHVSFERARGVIKFILCDDGNGVSEEELERLTDRFFRSTSAAAPGSGLGLAIVKRIAEYYDASLSISHGENKKGLSVTVTIPQVG